MTDLASFVVVKNGLSFVLDYGTGPTGKQVTKTVSLSRIKSGNTADKLSAVSLALAPLLNFPVLETLHVSTNSVEA